MPSHKKGEIQLPSEAWPRIASAPRSVDRLLKDTEIIRHRGKIESAIGNARRACDLADEFGSFSAFQFRAQGDRLGNLGELGKRCLRDAPRASAFFRLDSPEECRGWSFVGPTTLYAFIQAMGMVNDHIEGCDTRSVVERARRKFVRPS